jgi:DNA-binding XRE family transcriptional regulator
MNPREAGLAAQVGAAAKEARKKARLTQEDVAERIGITPEVYGRLERGIILPSVPTLWKVCRVLGVRADAMLGLERDEAPVQATPAPGTGESHPPELRRLLRKLRTMDGAQLAAIKAVTKVMQRQSTEASALEARRRTPKVARRHEHGK